MIMFHFILIFWKNPILKRIRYKFFKNSTCIKCLILQNKRHVNEILIFFKFQVKGALKDTYVLSTYACYNHNISKF
jgi:hypothetical protein